MQRLWAHSATRLGGPQEALRHKGRCSPELWACVARSPKGLEGVQAMEYGSSGGGVDHSMATPPNVNFRTTLPWIWWSSLLHPFKFRNLNTWGSRLLHRLGCKMDTKVQRYRSHTAGFYGGERLANILQDSGPPALALVALDSVWGLKNGAWCRGHIICYSFVRDIPLRGPLYSGPRNSCPSKMLVFDSGQETTSREL